MGLDFVEFTDVAVTHFCLEMHSVCWDWSFVDGIFCGDITNNSFKALDNSMTLVELPWDISGTDVVKDGFASTFVIETSITEVDFDWFLGWRALMRACPDDWKAIFGDINCDRWRSLLRADLGGVAGMEAISDDVGRVMFGISFLMFSEYSVRNEVAAVQFPPRHSVLFNQIYQINSKCFWYDG